MKKPKILRPKGTIRTEMYKAIGRPWPKAAQIPNKKRQANKKACRGAVNPD